MKAELKFNLPEDQEEFNSAIYGEKLRLVIMKLDGELRSIVKYGDEKTYTEKEIYAYDKCRDILREALEECGVSYGMAELP